MTPARPSGTHRARLKESITQNIVALTGDRASAEQRAEALIAERAKRTKVGLGVACMTIAVTAFAVWRHMSDTVVMTVGIAGGAFAGHTWSGGYLGASLKDFAATVGAALKSIASGLAALVSAKGGAKDDEP